MDNTDNTSEATTKKTTPTAAATTAMEDTNTNPPTRRQSAPPPQQTAPPPPPTAYYNDYAYYHGGGAAATAPHYPPPPPSPYYAYPQYGSPPPNPYPHYQPPIPEAATSTNKTKNTNEETAGTSLAAAGNPPSSLMSYWEKLFDDKDSELRKLQDKLDATQMKLREESVSNAEIKAKSELQITEHENQIQLLKMEHRQELQNAAEEEKKNKQKAEEESKAATVSELKQLQDKLDETQTLLREESVCKAEIKCKMDNQTTEHENEITILNLEHQQELQKLKDEKMDEFKQKVADEELIYLQEKFDKLQDQFRESSVAAVDTKSKLELQVVEYEKQIENMNLLHQQQLNDAVLAVTKEEKDVADNKKKESELLVEQQELSSIITSLEKQLQEKEIQIIKISAELEKQKERCQLSKQRATNADLHCKDLMKENQTLRKLTLRLHSQLAWFYGLTGPNNPTTAGQQQKRGDAEPSTTPEDGGSACSSSSKQEEVVEAQEEEAEKLDAVGVRFEVGAPSSAAPESATKTTKEINQHEKDEDWKDGSEEAAGEEKQQEQQETTSLSETRTASANDDDGIVARSEVVITDSSDEDGWVTAPEYNAGAISGIETNGDETISQNREAREENTNKPPELLPAAASHHSDDDGDDGPVYIIEEDDTDDDGVVALISAAAERPKEPEMFSASPEAETETYTMEDKIAASAPPITCKISARGRDGGFIAAGDSILTSSTGADETKPDASILPSILESDSTAEEDEEGGVSSGMVTPAVPPPPPRRYGSRRTPSPKYLIPPDDIDDIFKDGEYSPVLVGSSSPESPTDAVRAEADGVVGGVFGPAENDLMKSEEGEEEEEEEDKKMPEAGYKCGIFDHRDNNLLPTATSNHVGMAGRCVGMDPSAPSPKVWTPAYDFLEYDDDDADEENPQQEQQFPPLPFPNDLKSSAPETSTTTTDGPTVASSTFGDPRQKVYEKLLRDPYGDMGLYTGTVLQSTQMPHGNGRMIYHEPGREYHGDWRHGRWHGHGRSVFSNGDSYEGEYKYDQRHGRGCYRWFDGRVYEGPFVDDKRQGYGTFRWPDGSVYEGEYVRGLRHGQGKYTFAPRATSSSSSSKSPARDDDDRGGRYEGEWKNGRYDGLGTCVWGDGRRYQGGWKNGMMNGKGVETNPDGTIHHDGLWKDDEPVLSET